MNIKDLKKGDKVRYLGRKDPERASPHIELKVGDVVTVEDLGCHLGTIHYKEGTYCSYFGTSVSKWELVKQEEDNIMKKSDLVAGKHIVETRNGEDYIVLEGGILHDIVDGGWLDLSDYSEDMKFTQSLSYADPLSYDIMKVYTFEISPIRRFSLTKEQFHTKIWERNPPLTEEQKELAELTKQSEELATRMKALKDKIGG